ncbi:hypothetical protein MKX01_014973 [Papaver californicum]|nr:hypothetical protein MKX01_014973 [Papaver californicum]
MEDLECERRRKDEEVDFWKRKFLDLQNQFVIQKEYEVKHGALYVELQKKNEEFVGVEGKLKESTAARVSIQNELSKKKDSCDKMNEKIEEFMRRFRDLEIQAGLRFKYELDLERKLEVYTTKFDELCVRFREKKARGISLENELKEYKQMCVQLKEQIESLEEDKKALIEREKKEQERITLLEEENKKLLICDEGEKLIQLNEEKEELRTRLNSLTDFWMNNGIELMKELEVYRKKCNGLSLELKDKEMKCVEFEEKLRDLMSIKVAFDKEIEGYKTAFSGLNEHIIGLSEDLKVSCEREKKSQERITYLEEVVKKIGTGRESETQVSRLDEGNSALRLSHSRGNRERESEPRGSQSKGKNNINERLCSEMDSATDDAHVLPSIFEEKMFSNTEKILISAFPPSCNPASLQRNRNEHVSGSYYNVKDDKMNTALASRVELVTIVEKQLGHELEGRSSEKLLMPEQGSGTTLLRGLIEIDYSDHGKEISPNHTCNTTNKEKDQRCEEYEGIFEEDDTLIPFSVTAKKVRIMEASISITKSIDDVAVPDSSTMILCASGQKIENSVSSLRRKSVSPRQCPGKSYCAESTIKHLHNVVDEVGSDDSEGKCFGEICVKSSGSSGSGNSFSSSIDSKCIDLLKRNRLRESKWQFEADMLSSFEEDPKLCMKATRSSCSNNRGFNKYDALWGAALAEFLMDGDQEGDLKKSVQDLEMFDRKAVGDCRRLAANQLFSMYQKNQDPFFLPT